MPINTLRTLTAVVSIMVVIDALWAPAVLGTVYVFPVVFNDYILPIAGGVDMSAMVFRILTVIAFATWIYLAGKNLIAAGYEDLEFSPASRIWWFAVPIATWFKPYQGMRELWNASHGSDAYDETSPLIALWWGLWLVSSISGYFIVMTAGAGPSLTGLWIDSVAGMAVAVPAILMINRITAAQQSLGEGGLAEVFA